jgi:glycosyltransferase involved in cell wall biosynthesis
MFYGTMLRNAISGVFAISPLAVEQYRRIGIPASKVFRFGYFIPATSPSINRVGSSDQDAPLRIIYVGSLIARKGIDVLINAANKLSRRGLRIRVDVFGPGNPADYEFDGAVVKYCGRIPFGRSQQVISEYDLLVVPSRYDGWGVVVNEALMVGVPVVCSNRVGAGAIVDKWKCGRVYNAEDEDALAETLRGIAIDRGCLSQMRLWTTNVRATLHPKIAAHYLWSVINSPPGKNPSSPWY